MNASFGIDHPLLATHDINGLRARLTSLGFNMTAIGKHPWGTSTSLAMFDGCLIEIMGIYDDTLLDQVPAGDFRFGRHVYDHLQIREGVALSALHSTGSHADADTAIAAGFTLAGHLEFGRDVTLPDGTAGRTRTTLALLPDPDFPRLSFFLCQQHKPELIYVPEWLRHPNSVFEICGISIMANAADHAALKTKLSSLYGAAESIDGGFQVNTANGPMRVQTSQAIETEFGPLPFAENTPCIVAMDLKFSDPAAFATHAKTSDIGLAARGGSWVTTTPSQTANTFLRFSPSAPVAS
jgi:hypothetical protein